MTRERESSGFTVVELAITMGIAMVVMTSILGVLVSQSNAERRVSTFADNQEVNRQAIVLIQRDIRSAEPLEELPTSMDYALQINLNVYEDVSAPPVPIRWKVDTATSELRRELLDSAGNPTAVTYRVANVANTFALGNHLFEYFQTATEAPYNLATDDKADIAQCTVRIRINLRAAPAQGPQPALLSSDAQLRNRLPGGIGCTSL
jgi:type II secretory pathway pseudopilin PulG